MNSTYILALYIPFFDSKNGKVLLSFLISLLHSEFFHLVFEVLNKNFICSCKVEGRRRGRRRGKRRGRREVEKRHRKMGNEEWGEMGRIEGEMERGMVHIRIF